MSIWGSRVVYVGLCQNNGLFMGFVVNKTNVEHHQPYPLSALSYTVAIPTFKMHTFVLLLFILVSFIAFIVGLQLTIIFIIN